MGVWVGLSLEASLYLQSNHEVTDPKTSLRSATAQNTHTQSDLASIFPLITSEIPPTWLCFVVWQP